MSQDSLQVMAGDLLVGYLARKTNDSWSFEYASQWLEDDDNYAISHSLPLSETIIETTAVKNFFCNLLPEGSLRTLIARRLGISESNDFGLFQAIGGDCAGALSVVSKQDQRDEGKSPPLEELDDRALRKILANPPELANMLGDGRLRLSLAGAQEKLPIVIHDNKMYLPQKHNPSSHIIKLPNSYYPRLPENEVFVSHLAKAVGLNVVATSLKKIDQTGICVVERYDRIQDQHGRLIRIHQEDLCQTLGLESGRKYEEEGGPDFASCYQMIKKLSNNPQLDTGQLLSWQIFNVFINNADGHAKNVSFIINPGEGNRYLAPFYDLVCTKPYAVENKLAMSVAGRRAPKKIRMNDWYELADQIAVKKKTVANYVEKMAAGISSSMDRVKDEFLNDYGPSPVLDQIAKVIRWNLAWL
jgi:serine/threonine-protein kinase HipA